MKLEVPTISWCQIQNVTQTPQFARDSHTKRLSYSSRRGNRGNFSRQRHSCHLCLTDMAGSWNDISADIIAKVDKYVLEFACCCAYKEFFESGTIDDATSRNFIQGKFVFSQADKILLGDNIRFQPQLEYDLCWIFVSENRRQRYFSLMVFW